MPLRRLATSFGALALANGFAQIAGFVVIVVLARRLTVEQIGAYSFALSVIGYFAIPANFGVTVLATRDLARNPQDARRIMGEVLPLQAFTSLVPYALLVLLAPLIAIDDDSRAILPIVGVNFVIEGTLFMWVLFGTNRFGWLAIGRVLGTAIFTVLCLVTVQAGPDAVTDLAWLTLSGVVVTSVITSAVALRDQGAPRVERSARVLARRFRLSAPFGAAAVFISIYYTIDSVMLGYLEGTEIVGQYAIAYKVPLAVISVAALWGSVLFPHASALAQRSKVELREQLDLFGSLALCMALPVFAGALLVAGDLVPRLFGAQYTPASTPFVLLMGAATIIIVSMSYGTVQLAMGDERRYLVAVGSGAALNLVVNFAAIPLFGMEGAAGATILAEVAVTAYVLRRLRSLLGPLRLEWNRVARAALATAIMTVVLLPLGDFTVLVRVVIGTTVWVTAAALLRVMSADELRRLRPGGAATPVPEPPQAIP